MKRSLMMAMIVLQSLAFLLSAGPLAAVQGEKAFLPENPRLVLWQDPEDQARGFDVDERRVIEVAYAVVQTRFADSGYDVTLAVADFFTVYENRFDKVFWTDLTTLPSGLVLDVQINELTLLDREISRLHFKPSWTERGDWMSVPEWADLGTMTLKAALRSAGADDPELLLTEAVTSFEVTVGFDGEERSYRAAVLWQPADNGVAMVVQDHIVQGVEDIIIETAPSTPFEDLENLRYAEAETPRESLVYNPAGERIEGSCVPDSYLTTRPRLHSLAGTHEHKTGQHNASIQLQATCTCTSDCVVGCSPHLSVAACREFGELTGVRCHKKASKTQQAGDSALGASVKCFAGQGCFIRSCSGCLCGGIQIEVSVGPFGITFNTDTPVIADYSMSDHATCFCEETAGCSSSENLTAVLDLEGTGASLDLPDSSVRLERLVDGPLAADGTQVRYLVEEWALVSLEPGATGGTANVRVLAASSADFGAAKHPAQLRIGGAVPASGPRHTKLVIEAPKHPSNSRSMPVPGLELEARRLPFELPDGKLLVRGFYGEDRNLDEVQFLYAFEGYPSLDAVPDELADFLRSHLVVDASPHGERSHAVVAFAVLESRQGQLRLVKSERILPRCCCGGEFCV